MKNVNLGQQAWEKYKAIEQVLIRHYWPEDPNRTEQSQISMALQILGEAVIIQQELVGKELFSKWNFQLQQNKIQTLPLSNIFDMIHVRIPVWEEAVEAIPAYQVGHDSWVEGTRGRQAGYWEHASLCDLVGEKIFKRILIKDMTLDVARTLYERIQLAVNIETEKLLSTNDSVASDKGKKITEAMSRLWNEIYNRLNGIKSQNTVDLYSIETMLDAQLGKEESEECIAATPLSVRQALNLSRNNPFSLFGLQPPLWGKATSLINVEKQLSLSNPNRE